MAAPILTPLPRKHWLKSWLELIALAISIGLVVGVIVGVALVTTRLIGGAFG